MFFSGCRWYQSLEPPANSEESSAWFVAKGDLADVHPAIVNAGLSFAIAHGLDAQFRRAFERLRPHDFLESRATAEGRSVSFPIWEIANELVVAAYLERVLGWTFLDYEPVGRPPKRGDWLFRAPSGKEVFVEVKSITEPMGRGTTGVYSRSSKAPLIRRVLTRGYAQLPRDGPSTLIVLVALDDILRLPTGSIIHGDVFEALFGAVKITFRVMPFDPESMRMGPSLREMFVQKAKHRRMGAAVGLDIRGFGSPQPRLYVIHNPFAHDFARLNPSDFPGQAQLYFHDGIARFSSPMPVEDVWGRMNSSG